MKKLFIVAAFAMTGLAVIPGCKKSTSSSPYSMTATVNGASFKGSNCIASMSGTLLNITGGNFTGTSTVYPNIIIDISDYTGAGTYDIPGSSTGIVNGATIDSSATINAAVAIRGTITITGTSPNLVGTFSFNALDSTVVTNGAFIAKAP